MSPDPRTFRRNVCVIAGLAVTARLIIAAVSWRSTTALSEASEGAARAQETLAALESVRASLGRAQSAELAYLLTGEGSDLAELDDAERAARRQLAHAWTMTQGEGPAESAFGALARAVDQRFELKGAAVAARRAGLTPEKARIAVKLGADATARASAAVDEVRAAELSMFEERSRASRVRVKRALTGIGITAVLSLAAIVGFALWLLPAFDARVAERDALRPSSPSGR